MKQRILSALVGLVLLAVVLVCYQTVVFPIVISILVLLAVGELLKAAGLFRYKALTALSLAFSALMPVLQMEHLSNFLGLLCAAYAFLMFLILIGNHNTLRIEQISFAFFATLMVPFSFSTVLFIHNRYPTAVSILYLLITLGGAWLTDSGAYFVGCKFGRHKMAPQISPKKTVEGAIGGVIVNIVCYFLITVIYVAVAGRMGYFIQVNYLALGCLAPIASLAGILGDLSASVIKRQYGVKDFGSIMPGHGGVMDRFDSVLFVAPTVFLYIYYITIFSVA